MQIKLNPLKFLNYKEHENIQVKFNLFLKQKIK